MTETLWGRPWGEGIYWWYWSTDPDQGGLDDKNYTPHLKPAEVILQRCYLFQVNLPIVLKGYSP